MMYQLKKFLRDLFAPGAFKYSLDDVMIASPQDFEVIVKGLAQKNNVRQLQRISNHLTHNFNRVGKKAAYWQNKDYTFERQKALPYLQAQKEIGAKKSILIRYTAQMGGGN